MIRQFNSVELWVSTELRDRESGYAVAHQGQYKVSPAGDDVGQEFSNVPVYSAQQVKEITDIHGSINLIDPAAAPVPYRTFTIRRLDNDPEYVMIYEWDNSKDHHLTDLPHDPVAWEQSELGKKYARLRKEKEAYLAKVTERIAQRTKE